VLELNVRGGAELIATLDTAATAIGDLAEGFTAAARTAYGFASILCAGRPQWIGTAYTSGFVSVALFRPS